MGRWVTSKGRKIYIPDEGEENPFAKNKSGKGKKETSDKNANKTENQRREDDLKKQLDALKGKEFNKDARVVIDDLRARLDEHRRFEGAVEDMDERLKELKKKEAQITKTDAFNPQARKTLKDLRARIDEINKMNRNDAHEPTSYKKDKTSKIISDNEAKKEKEIAGNKKQAEQAGVKGKSTKNNISQTTDYSKAGKAATNNVAHVCNTLGWKKPLFIDKTKNGYRIKAKTDSLKKAESNALKIKKETGIDVTIRKRRGYGDYSIEGGYDYIVPFSTDNEKIAYNKK